MKNQDFEIYREKYVTLKGSIAGGCLHLESYVYDDDFSSEKYYDFSQENTDKLLQIISLEQFIELCREKKLMGMEEFLEKNDIQVKTYTF